MAHEVPYGKVVGRFLMPVAVDSNADAHLEPTPAAGTVTFTPSVKSIQFFDLAEPVTITPTSVTVTLDAEGYIVDSTGARGVSLVATENPGAIPASATYKVKTAFAGRGGGRTFSINVPVGGVVDLAVAAPPLPGVAIAPTVIEDIIQTRTIATDAATAASGSATQAAASATEAATQAGVVEGVALDKIAAINSTAGLRVAEVNSAGVAQVTSVQGAGDQELADITAAGAAKVSEVNTAGAARLSEVNTAGAVKVAEVNAAGAAEVANLNTLDLILTAETGAPGTEVQATTSGTFPNIGVALKIPRGDQGFERFLVESGGVYPARNFTGPAVFIGASNPDTAGLMVDGDTWVNNENVAVPGMPITGTGMPEGVITAPIGTEYIDTAATNGAVKWVKASGTGSTGWKVVYGDTGWRAIQDSELLQGLTGYINAHSYRLSVRRINDVIHVSGALGNVKTAADNANASGSSQVWAAPLGFRAGGPMKHFKVSPWGGATQGFLMRYDNTGLHFPYPGQTPAGMSSGWIDTVAVPTTDPWPTILPGIGY